MAASGDSTPAIREKIVSGGIYMAGRWGIGTAVSLIGTVAITRAVGPSQYGVFAAVLAIFMYVSNIGSFGLDVYLIRLQAVSIPRRTIDTAFWLTSGLAVVLGAGGALLALVGPNVVNGANWTVTALLGSAAFTFSLISNIPLALLEKELDFRRVAAVELTNQYLFYAVAVPGAILFKAAWAPAAGLVIQQAVAVVAFSAAASYRPHFAWSTAVARDGLKYGLSMTGAQSIYQLRQLVNPLIIGATLGAAATGYVALAIRMIETLSFVRSVTWRLAIAAFSKIRADLPKTRRAIGEGMPLQVLALGSFLLPLCWVSTFVVPIVFGPQWRPSIGLLPYIAVGYLVNMAFSTNSAALFVAARNRDVAVFHTFHVALFAGAAYVFAHVYGLRGYGYAELAGLGAYPYLAWRTDRAFGGSPGLSLAMIWLASFCVAMFVHVVGWWSAAALAPVVLWPRSWATASIVVTPMMALIPRPWAPRGSSRRRRPVQYAARWRGQWVSPAWCSLYVLLFVGMVLSSAASPRFFAENTAAANATLISPSFDGRILECTLGGLVLLCVIAVGAGRLYRSDARHWVVIGVASIGPALGGIFGPMPDKHFQYLGLLLVGAVILLLPRLSLAAYARVVRGVLLLVVGGSLVAAVIVRHWALQSGYTQGFLPLPRLHGVAPDANELAPLADAYVMMFRVGEPPGRKRYAGVLLALVVVILSQSKTSIIILAAWWVLQYVGQRSRGTATLRIGNVLVVGAVAAIVALALGGVLSTSSTYTNASKTLSSRTAIWDITVDYWRQSPLIGIGPNLWGAEMSTREEPVLGFQAPTAHDQLFQSLGEGGVVGVIGLSFVLAYMLVEGLGLNAVSRGASSGLALLFLVRCIDETPLRSNLTDGNLFLFAVTFGLLVTARRAVRDRSDYHVEREHRDRFVAGGVT